METENVAYLWKGNVLVQDGALFEMPEGSGMWIMPVMAAKPVLEENFRNSDWQYTRFGWVYAHELTPIDIPVLQVYLDFLNCAKETSVLEDQGPLPETFAALVRLEEVGIEFHNTIVQHAEAA